MSIVTSKHTVAAPGQAAGAVRRDEAAGRGVLELRHVAGRTVVTRSRAASPLKMLTPRRQSPAAWVYLSSYGGGLVSGDHVDLSVDVGAGAMGVLGTQASTKVYRSGGGAGARQTMTATIGGEGLLVVAPDPLVCYRGARYEQHQRFELAAGASLVLVDWFTCGRLARGERWAMARLHTRNDVYVEGRCVARDAVMLDAADGAIDSGYRVGPYHCFATLMLVGPRAEALAARAVETIGREPLGRKPELLQSASPQPWGAVVRAAGMSAESVGGVIAGHLAGLRPLLGAESWERKF